MSKTRFAPRTPLATERIRFRFIPGKSVEALSTRARFAGSGVFRNLIHWMTFYEKLVEPIGIEPMT